MFDAVGKTINSLVLYKDCAPLVDVHVTSEDFEAFQTGYMTDAMHYQGCAVTHE